jgi:superfamily II DNA helicase RecQ
MIFREELSAYRFKTSREENVKAFFIFNNAERDELIAKYPRTEEELLEGKGFGRAKVEKYGEPILSNFNGEVGFVSGKGKSNWFSWIALSFSHFCFVNN